MPHISQSFTFCRKALGCFIKLKVQNLHSNNLFSSILCSILLYTLAKLPLPISLSVENPFVGVQHTKPFLVHWWVLNLDVDIYQDCLEFPQIICSYWHQELPSFSNSLLLMVFGPVRKLDPKLIPLERVDMVRISLGMWPLSLLYLRFIKFRFWEFPRFAGMLPLISLKSRKRLTSWVRLLRVDGISR